MDRVHRVVADVVVVAPKERYTYASPHSTPEAKRERWHALWREIHTQDAPSEEWWLGIVLKVRRMSCQCDQFLKSYLPTNPPRYDDWFAWTVELHNDVNAKLGKPQVALQEAREIWGV